MSILLKSDSDSDSSSSDVTDDANSIIEEETQVKPIVPLTTSVVIDKLPIEQQSKLSKTLEHPGATKAEKVTIRFQAIGSTPSITPRIFMISSTQTVSTLMKFLIKKLRIKNNTIYLYIQNSFQPTPDEVIGDLFLLFKTNNELVISYCKTIAFG